MVQQRTRKLVVDDQLAAARRDREAPVAGEAIELVAVEAGGVHEEARSDRTFGRLQFEAAVAASLDSGDTYAASELAAVQHRFGGVRQRRRERTDDALVWNVERAMGARTEVWLAPVELFDSHFPNGGVAVRACTLDDSGELDALLRSPGDEKRADACERDAGLRCIRGEQLVSAPHESRLERARRGVEARMQ